MLVSANEGMAIHAGAKLGRIFGVAFDFSSQMNLGLGWPGMVGMGEIVKRRLNNDDN